MKDYKICDFFTVKNGNVSFIKKIYASAEYANEEKKKLEFTHGCEILLIMR